MVVARQVFVLLSVLVVGLGLVERCEASGKFSFQVHHMFSDAVKQNLGFDHLVPEKGSLEYFKVLAHRDQLIRGRGLASNNEESPITSSEGNFTLALNFLGFLHYANVSVGTPATWFLVALDTGSDLFWLPCNCGNTCIRDLQDAGLQDSIPLNLYSPNASTTSSSIGCSDKRCFESRRCSSPASICPYQISSSTTTSTTGTLLQDVLHLVTEDADLNPVKANITLGCGQNQTGLFQKDVSVNGVLGLGVKEYSVPSLLAKANITANSFSMCFGRVVDIVGRISFGDKGYTDQQETPFVSVEPSAAYGVNVTGMSVGGDPIGVGLFALFDSGSSFTHLMNPAYGLFTKAFNDQVDDKRLPVDPTIPFEFCYVLSPNLTTVSFSPLEMTFAGGSTMRLKNPFISARTEAIYSEGSLMYCLGILKSEDVNIIGQNFMSGYRVVFDRERMILGWKRSNCFEDESLESTTPPPPEFEAPPPRASAPPPAIAATPPPIDPRDSTGSPEAGGAVSLHRKKTMDVSRQVFVLFSVLVVGFGLVERCEAAGGKFSFQVHHMFSDAVKQTLGFDHLVPEKGSLEYYKVLAHRDQLIRGRGLASNNEEPPVTFMRGNRTLELDLLGYLHYANVSVGTPATWFLVALDTGSDLFWLPCNCGNTCMRDLQDLGLSESRPLNLYAPNVSSTSSSIRCSDKRCFGLRGCSSPSSICPYQVQYLSNNTATRGTLFEDVLHLVTEDDDLEPVKANVTLGCGQNQTGLLRRGMAVNGLLGLGMQDYSVPSVLAKANITTNSFSMCFGNIIDIIGRISFGDKGYTDQLETPLVPVGPTPTYAVDVTEVSVGGEDLGVELLAIVDTGTSFTHLMEPAYGLITKTFDDQVTDKRRPMDPKIPFEFCYDLSPNATTILFPKIVMTFGEGSQMSLRNPLFMVTNEDESFMYCLGILKSVDFKLNIIGQNFMSGYRIVFDRERMILGWKRSNCFEDESLAATPPPPQIKAPAPKLSTPLSPSPPPRVSVATPPPVNPRDSTGNSGTGGAANLSLLASQVLFILPLLAFL
ncbi:unnamed protein product [Thlaspi arvense]|uniref:Peptidase A1 domain-containing protein n=1 Tax=Thlaspi arvense TaxID=13288 RepID=A0AAU9SEI9_THLAR|nr:unnamed protein product [Thlaspi arvense]